MAVHAFEEHLPEPRNWPGHQGAICRIRRRRTLSEALTIGTRRHADQTDKNATQALFIHQACRRGDALQGHVAFLKQASSGLQPQAFDSRSEEHTSELHSIIRNSYAVFCLRNKNTKKQTQHKQNNTPDKET